MQATGLLNYRLKYCWPKVTYCICQPNELERKIKKKTGGDQAKISEGYGLPRPPLESPLESESQSSSGHSRSSSNKIPTGVL